nr:NSP1 [Rotavirus sp.]
MATFKDACYHYKRMNKLNGSILKLGANDEWRPAPITRICTEVFFKVEIYR